MKPNKKMIVAFLAPAVIAYMFVSIYPVIHSTILSFFEVSAWSGSEMKFVGLSNFIDLSQNSVFINSFGKIGIVWLLGGVGVFGSAFVFSALLTSGIKGKAFFRAAIYLPNLIPVVAVAAMWTQYIFSMRFGLFKNIFGALGLTSLANIEWTSHSVIFWAMLIAYVWGGIGFFLLIILAGVERIPVELLEAARLDGASLIQAFARITLPLLRDVIRVAVVMWSITVLNLFAFPMAFGQEYPEVMTPAIYLYQLAFGQAGGSSSGAGANGVVYIGKAAAAGVILTVIVVLVYGLLNVVFREEKLEY
jgi:multiple sugar transport system permease protein/N-acetylglucosamine transport system permease protein